MLRWVPALALVVLLTGCASSGPAAQTGGTVSPHPTPSPASSAAPAPRFIGPSDGGRMYSMTVGQTTTLRISDPDAAEPEAEGTAVLLIAVANVTGSGAREWEVRAVEPGTSTIVSDHHDPSWEITLVVED